MALAKNQRLNLRLHRFRVQQTAKELKNDLFTVLVSSRPDSDNQTLSRFAVLISKKISPLAVTRNKLKRDILNSIQKNLSSLPQGQDFIIIPKKTILKVNLQTITTKLLKLLS